MHSNIGIFHLFSKKPNCPLWSFFSPTWRSKQLSAFCLYRFVCSRHVTWVNHTYCMVFLRCFLSLRIMFANFQGLPMFWHHVWIPVDHISINCDDQIIHYSVDMPYYVYLSANEYWDCLLSYEGWFDYAYTTTCTVVGLSWLGRQGMKW